MTLYIQTFQNGDKVVYNEHKHDSSIFNLKVHAFEAEDQVNISRLVTRNCCLYDILIMFSIHDVHMTMCVNIDIIYVYT